MYQELREALKTAVAAVKPIRERIRATKDWERYEAWNDKRAGSSHRRTLHLALCYLRGTPYKQVEAKSTYTNERVPQVWRTMWMEKHALGIVETLVEYGCTPEGVSLEDAQKSVIVWLSGGAAAALCTARNRVPKLYIVVRADLPPGAQAVQVAHAMREFAAEYPDIEREWHEKSNTLVMLVTASRATLQWLQQVAKQRGIAVTGFQEPDLRNELTAICVGPEGYWLPALKQLPLALKAA